MVHVSKQMVTYPCSTLHRIGHLLIASQRLYSEAHCLELRAHLIEFLDVSSSADEVFSHHFARILGQDH